MHRRDVLKLAGALGALALFPQAGRAQERFLQANGPWRKFEIITRIDILKPEGMVQAWVPVPSLDEPDWSMPAGSDWQTNAAEAQLVTDADNGVEMVHFVWKEGEAAPFAEVNSHCGTRDRVTDFSRPPSDLQLSEEDIQRYTAATAQHPFSPALRKIAEEITEKAKTDIGKAKAIYEWLIDTASCNPKALEGITEDEQEPDGCGNPNSTYVSFARASGLPTREFYGLRVAGSQSGLSALGAPSEIVTNAQHRRAEVWLSGYGWVAVNPGDIRRIIKGSEAPKLALNDPKVVSARHTLFGGWEGNWIAYNMANNIVLPGSDMPPLDFFMHPQAKTSTGMLNFHKPETFKYVITAKELPA